MNLVYNSQNYSVVEYPAQGGYELIDKQGGTTSFMLGDAAMKFRASIQEVIAKNPTVESVDEFLDDFEPASEQRLVYH